jgi:hypothetical protein
VSLLVTGCELLANIQDLQQGSVDSSTDDSSTSSLESGVGSTSSSAGSSSLSKVDSTAPIDATDGGDGSPGVDGTVIGADAAADGGDATFAAPDASDSSAADATGVTMDAGTADAGTPDAGTLNTELIDNFASDDGHIRVYHGRSGSWYSYNDKTSDAQTPAPLSAFLPVATMPALPGSTFAAETTGSGFLNYAGMGFTLNDPPSTGIRATYDAGAYLGFSFTARVGVGSATLVRFELLDQQTDTAGNFFGEFVTLTTQWAQYTVRFSDMTQPGFGTSYPAPDTTAAYGVQFQFQSPQDTAPIKFDLWVANISFVTQ